MRTLLIAILLMLAILPGCCLISLHPLGNLAEKSAPPTPELPS